MAATRNSNWICKGNAHTYKEQIENLMTCRLSGRIRFTFKIVRNLANRHDFRAIQAEVILKSTIACALGKYFIKSTIYSIICPHRRHDDFSAG